MQNCHRPFTGSSPLTRGKLQAIVPIIASVSLIPAHAGKTFFQESQEVGVGAHPRSRGENPGSLHLPLSFSGSSPLTRGKLRSSKRELRLERLIPAHAGKTAGLRGVRFRREAHPRSRGENQSVSRRCGPATGSSPLTRGKRGVLLDELVRRRLIPAHAGKTTLTVLSATSRKAHPRSRGENSVADTEIATHRGSSPLTRGKLPGENDSRAWAGLIPAHAGKTITWLAQLITSWAHPRSRGENVRRAQYPPPTGGSSPLTRGKRRPPTRG